jgi:3'-phosphoadenosine 5'-phosphosulfate sulfotransferase (PAPS reductase)/FAD synthetase
LNFTENIEKQLIYIDTFAKATSVLDEYKDKKIRMAYSGGSDSDTCLWLLRYLGYEVDSVFYDTGLEYDATWKHLDYMKSEGFNIEIIKAIMPIPISNKKYGSPFISKYASQMICALQRYGFDFTKEGDLSFEELSEKYSKCTCYIRWWCNKYTASRYNISWNKGLKEFLIKEGLPFKVSDKCCDGAKKQPIKKYIKENNIDLMILGIRKAEGGKRAGIYKQCFVPAKSYNYSMYFPLFWWNNEDKLLFDTEMKIKHSDCYQVYGLPRTGCAGCPFGRHFEDELSVIQEYEPKLYKGINNIFGQSYEWTRKYREYQKEIKNEN